MTDGADLLSTIRRMLVDAGLYLPESAARHGLVLSAEGDTVVISWAPTAPVPAARTAFAIRTALLELLDSHGLSTVYRRDPGHSSGTITVTDPRSSQPASLPAAS